MYFFTAFILFLTLLNIVVYYSKKQQEEDDVEKNDPSSSPDKQCRRFKLAEIKQATNDFDDALVVGKGGHGKVYKGKFDFWEGVHVAIKRSNLESNQGAAEFWVEIEMLSKFRHSHIVSLLGYCEKEMILVYEYMPNGSLDDRLHKRRSNYSPLTWVQRLNICTGAARGLDYLHTGTGVHRRVVHRDVKSSNILLDEKLVAKISDFGVSRIGQTYQSGSTADVYTNQIRGTFGYMDAEYFSTHRLTRKSDVYAFGVVLLEVLSGRPALDFTLDEQQHSLAGWAKQCIKEGRMGQIFDPCLKGQAPFSCLKEFGQLAYECILTRSKDRPTMTKVLARLEFVLTWTLQSAQIASDRFGRSMFIEKAWSMFLTKGSILRSSDAKTLGQSIGKYKKVMMMKKHATKVVEVGCHSRQMVPLSPSGQTMISSLKMFKFSKLQRATENFKQDRFLGEGAFGKVYKGWLDSVTFAPRKAGDGLEVAIKKSNPYSTQGFNEWKAEVNFLEKFSHPNVVKLFGYCCEKNFLLVYEYMQKGSLDMHLFTEGAEPLPWDTRIKIATGVAQGLAFLHTTDNNIICRDVKCANILLDENYNAKLSDFGLATVGPVNGESHVSTVIVGTYGYTAPEYLATGCLYIKSDVYSFGVVMLELITGLKVLDVIRHSVNHNLVDCAGPFVLSGEKNLQKVIDPGLEQCYPSKGASKAMDLIINCLEQEPKNRPSMEEVVLGLQGINAIKMKPNQSKANTKHLSNSYH
ncbi:putative protein kinase RLK-Pelle-RLCK-VIIa-2 family [Helianthus annuus]|uniref:Protein kinase domain-containing protein n=1 Tax=Helianthus annuus TaxID=4232 RepID=A0A9K3HG73_HELAN|nr:putative protein kinase RLK-Pelle-RLCK-VIIa-2 family [Helianthus annuus]KAJ0862506.1 putative protein kinase RLK-Pelle-RLCK-VIIa-2 family [Helianthus annuus]KAJ0866297.1 putative protein kinase RLK-Pelle-RLCK-VIIa-2 family [Helianthus annuus]